MKVFKPENYTSLSPYLIVDGAEKFAALLKNIFDAEELRVYKKNDGSIMHMEMKLDDSVIMIADSSDEYPSVTTVLHMYVPDVQKTYQKAIDQGCISLKAPVNEGGDPDLRGTFKDFCGNLWSVSTQLGE